MQHKKQQGGGTVLGFILGLVVGLAVALAVAVYVTKVPIPFVNKGQSRSPEQDAAENKKNKDWDPNAPLYGKNPVKQASAASAATLPGIAAPTLVIGTRDDVATPAYCSAEIAAAIPGAELVVLPYGGHNAHQVVPEELQEQLLAFLTSAAVAARRRSSRAAR